MKKYLFKKWSVLLICGLAAAVLAGAWLTSPSSCSAANLNGTGDNQSVIPWESSPEFQQAASIAGIHIRMASFVATLKDPLPGELFNVGHAANTLSGTVVRPGEIFSQNRTLGPYTLAKGYKKGPTYSGNMVITTIGGGVCKIASVMYNVVRLSNLQVVERHNHSLTVPYVPPGQDATVYFGCRDFKFMNTTAGPVMLWARTYGNTLYMALYGQQLPPKVTWHHKTLKNIKTLTIYQFNPNLPPGTERISASGQDGIVVKSWLTVRYHNGKEITRDLGKDYYAPSPRVIERGPRKR
ncbi:MAG: VanW family protein [Eubacteriales bacterium]